MFATLALGALFPTTTCQLTPSGDYSHLVGGSGRGSGCRCTLEVLQQTKDSGGGAMDKIQDREGIANLPVTELEDALKEFLAPVAAQLPDVRLRRVLG